MRVEGDTFYTAYYDDGFEVRGSKDKLLEAMADKLSDMGDLPDDFFMSAVSLKVDDGDLNVRAEEILPRELLVYSFQSDEE